MCQSSVQQIITSVQISNIVENKESKAALMHNLYQDRIGEVSVI